jgi:pilus assembly protein CpaF
MINTILILASVIVFAIILFIMYQRSKLKTDILIEDDYSSIDKVLEAVKGEMVEILSEDVSLAGLPDSEFDALYKRKARIEESLSKSVHGIDGAKVIVIELIRGFISREVPIEKITDLLGLSDGMQPSDHVMFEILMYRYKKKHGKQALAELVKKYNWDDERPATHAENNFDMSYFVTTTDLHSVYDEEDIILSDDEKVDMLAIMVYQLYKGFGILDTLREMDINGFNCGTSGSILTNVTAYREGALKATNSVWIYHNGKYIHFRFMNFGSEDELKRIIQLLVRYNNPGPLTTKRGYLVNTMYDKSRILALRPSASEYWAVFVRKFTLSDVSPKSLLSQDYTRRGDLVIKLIEYVMRGMITAGVTGRQGSGKTTLMSSMIRYIDPRYNLRILEMAPELYLRELYPTRNILSVQETNTVSATELQDALKKSDAAVSIVGEVATDGIAARMIQLGMVASLFTLFSHHANTTEELVYALRNSLVNAGGFDGNMAVAERQVISVVKLDIHLDYTPDGKRYVERISEIIPLKENLPYPEIDENNVPLSQVKIQKEFYERMTDRKTFISRDILRYDLKTHTYYTVNRFSPELESRLRSNLGPMMHDYDKFVMAEWGPRKDLEIGQVDEVAQSLIDLYAYQATVSDPMSESLSTFEVSDNGGGGLFIHESTEEEKIKAVIDAIERENAIAADFFASEEEKETTESTASIEDHEDAILTFEFFDGGAKV